MLLDSDFSFWSILTNKWFFVAMVALVILSFVLIGKQNKKEKKETNFKKDVEERIESKTEKEEKLDDSMKMLFNLLNDADDAKGESDDNDTQTAKFLNGKINEDFMAEYSSVKNSIVIPDDMIDDISQAAKKKLGGLAEFIHRIDEDGKIIIPLDALDFITGSHEPLVMPDGSIRVLNLLSLESEILLSLQMQKPIFYIDEKENTVKKLLPKYIEKLTVKSSDVKAIDDSIKLQKEIDTLKEQNRVLFLEQERVDKENISLKDQIKTLEKEAIKKEDKVKTLQELISPNAVLHSTQVTTNINTDSKDEDENKSNNNSNDTVKETGSTVEEKTTELEDSSTDTQSEIKDTKEDKETTSSNKKEEVEKENVHTETSVKEPIVEKTISEVQETYIPQSTPKIQTDKEKNNVEVSAPVIPETKVPVAKEPQQKEKIQIVHNTNSDTQEEKEQKKLNITPKRLEKIKTSYIYEFELLKEKTFENSQGKASEQIFIGKKIASDKESHFLYFSFKYLIKDFEKFLEKNNYNVVPGELKNHLEVMGFKIEHMYFTEANGTVYRGYLCKIKVDNDLLAGQKFTKRFSNGFTVNELEYAIKDTAEPSRKENLEKTLTQIINKEYKELKDL